jgi:hypothetical protein
MNMNRGYKTMAFKTDQEMRHLADIEHDLQTLKNIKASFNMNYYTPVTKPSRHDPSISYSVPTHKA